MKIVAQQVHCSAITAGKKAENSSANETLNRKKANVHIDSILLEKL